MGGGGEQGEVEAAPSRPPLQPPALGASTWAQPPGAHRPPSKVWWQMQQVRMPSRAPIGIPLGTSCPQVGEAIPFSSRRQPGPRPRGGCPGVQDWRRPQAPAPPVPNDDDARWRGGDQAEAPHPARRSRAAEERGSQRTHGATATCSRWRPLGRRRGTNLSSHSAAFLRPSCPLLTLSSPLPPPPPSSPLCLRRSSRWSR